MEILVAGVGNVLRRDDGFGVKVAEHLLVEPIPDGVRVVEVGIGGIHLVQELFGDVGGLVVIDAMETNRAPGTVKVVRPDVHDVLALPPPQRHDELADMHYTTPDRAFLLARALGILPIQTWVVGCQPAVTETLGPGLSPAVAAAVPVAAAEVRRVVARIGVPWPQIESHSPGSHQTSRWAPIRRSRPPPSR